MAQTLTEIRRLLKAHGLRPKRALGQNFLHDGNQMARVLEAGGVVAGDVVLEVGPGTGGLSEGLLEAGARLVAVELDSGLEPLLRERLGGYGDRVGLVMGDVLKGKHEINTAVLGALAEAVGGSGGGFKLVANLPYQVVCPLLVNLARGVEGCRLDRAAVMVQREVADRLAASPGGREYGPVTVMVQAVYEVEKVGDVPPSCFWPAPKVDSSVVSLVRRGRALCGDLDRLGRLVHKLFNQRRKQIGKILGREKVLPGGIDPSWRPERLTLEQLIALSEAFG